MLAAVAGAPPGRGDRGRPHAANAHGRGAPRGAVAAPGLPRHGVLVFSQYVETTYTARLLADGAAGIGYLLKDRVGDVAEFTEALSRVAAGGTALDPEVVSSLMRAQRAGLAALTPRERQVLSRMAEGRSNSGIAAALVLTEGAVEKHIASIFAKLALDPMSQDNRRVLAVLRYLNA